MEFDYLKDWPMSRQGGVSGPSNERLNLVRHGETLCNENSLKWPAAMRLVADPILLAAAPSKHHALASAGITLP